MAKQESTKQPQNFDFFADFEKGTKPQPKKTDFDFNNLWGEAKTVQKQVSFDGFGVGAPIEQSKVSSCDEKTQSSGRSEDLLFFTVEGKKDEKQSEQSTCTPK